MLGWLVLAVCSSRILADPVVVVVHLNALKQASWRKRMCGCADIVLCVCVCHVWHQNPRVCTLHDTLFKTVCKTLYINGPIYPHGFACVFVWASENVNECDFHWTYDYVRLNPQNHATSISWIDTNRMYETSKQSCVYWHIESTDWIPKYGKLASYKLVRGFSMQFNIMQKLIPV